MRISDWSSDVCSSDLLDRRARRAAVVTPAFRDAARCEFVLDLFGDQMEFLDAVAQAIRQRPAVQCLYRRSEERRVGKECVSTCRYRWSPCPYEKKKKNTHAENKKA